MTRRIIHVSRDGAVEKNSVVVLVFLSVHIHCSSNVSILINVGSKRSLFRAYKKHTSNYIKCAIFKIKIGHLHYAL